MNETTTADKEPEPLVSMQAKGYGEWMFADKNDVNFDIRDFQSFMKEFAKYLLGRMSQDQAEDVMMLISCFADYNVQKDPRFSLAKLGNIFQLRSDDLVRLPSPFDGWLEKFSDLIPTPTDVVPYNNLSRKQAAHLAYENLLDFILELLVVHAGEHPCPYPHYSNGHIPEVENISRRQHLKALEELVLATHPTKFWANPSLLSKSN